MTSIRRRLTIRLIVALLAIMILGGAALYAVVRTVLLGNFDHALSVKARTLAGLVRREGQGFEFEFSDEFMPEFDRREDPEYFELRYADGKLIERSRYLLGGWLAPPEGAPQGERCWNLPLPGGHNGRAVAVNFSVNTDDEDDEGVESNDEGGLASDGQLTLAVARNRQEVDRALAALAMGLGAGGTLLALASVLVIRRVVRRGLAPLDDVSRAVAAVDASTLALPLPEQRLPEELEPIRRRLDELLTRLAAAFERERRFTSSAAHELRTPLAELRTLAEVSLRWPQPPEDSMRGMTQALEIAQQMEAMVTSLLTLARVEAGRETVRLARVDLARAINLAWTPLQVRATRKQLRCSLDGAAQAFVQSDPALLHCVLTNLLENAVEYAPEGGCIRVKTQIESDLTALTIANTNATLHPDDLPRIFEGFWRKDPSRTDASHAGLGLSLVQSYARILGMTATPSLTESGEFEMQLVFRGFEPAPSGNGQA